MEVIMPDSFKWSQSKGLGYRTTDYCKANLASLVFLDAVTVVHVGIAGRASSNLKSPYLTSTSIYHCYIMIL